jgi:hypothetical protein
MRKLITTLTAAIVMAGSVAWKAEAAAVTGVGNLPPPIKSYSPLQRVDCFLSPCSHPRYGYNGYGYNGYGYNGYGYNGYGYNGYGYRPYGYYGYGYRPYGYGYGRRY